MNEHKIYKITSIGRPVEPRYPTNKAVLIILPMAGIIAALYSCFVVGEISLTHVLSTGLYSMLVAFGSWALARELAPDDNPAAFISMALAYLVYLVVPGGSVLLLFVALALSRILNRSTGLAPRLSDSVIVTLLVIWASYTLGSPILAAIAALAFILDSRLEGPERNQWPFAVACFSATVILVVQQGFNVALPGMPSTNEALISPLVLLAFLLAIVSMKSVVAPGDIDGKPLVLTRVRAGMIIVLLIAATFLFSHPGQMGTTALLVATMAGIPAGVVLKNITGMKG